MVIKLNIYTHYFFTNDLCIRCRENDNVVAKMSVELDESGSGSRGRALGADEGADKQLERVLRSTVSSGHVGALSLDPKYFVFEAAPRKCF